MTIEQEIAFVLNRRFEHVPIPEFPRDVFQGADELRRGTRVSRRLRASPFAFAASALAFCGILFFVPSISRAVKPASDAMSARLINALMAATLPHVKTSRTPLKMTSRELVPQSLAQAQRSIHFRIVLPAGLPAGTRFRDATVSDPTGSAVTLWYEAPLHRGKTPIVISESRGEKGPVFSTIAKYDGHLHIVIHRIPRPRWKHGDITMSLDSAWLLPPDLARSIQRANTRSGP